MESRARRAAFNASVPGKNNLLGEKELVEDVASGRVDVKDLDRAQLPESLQDMPPEAQEAVIAKTAKKRAELQAEIRELNAQRSAYIKEKSDEAGGAEGSLYHKIFRAVKEQAADVGLNYEDDDVSY